MKPDPHMGDRLVLWTCVLAAVTVYVLVWAGVIQ
jgi:hypothetical protein